MSESNWGSNDNVGLQTKSIMQPPTLGIEPRNYFVPRDNLLPRASQAGY